MASSPAVSLVANKQQMSQGQDFKVGYMVHDRVIRFHVKNE